MKAQVKRGFVNIDGRDYFDFSLLYLDGQRVEVICGLYDDEVLVYLNGEFYCGAAHVPVTALSALYRADRVRFISKPPEGVRQPARYPVMDDFPPVPKMARSEWTMRREILRTKRSYRRLSRSVAGIENPIARREIATAVDNLCLALMDVSRLLDKEDQGGF